MNSVAMNIINPRALRSSVVKCLTRNPGVPGSGCSEFSGSFFVGVSLGKTLQSSSPVLVKPRKDMNSVSCRRDMTGLLFNPFPNDKF